MVGGDDRVEARIVSLLPARPSAHEVDAAELILGEIEAVFTGGRSRSVKRAAMCADR